MYVHAFGLRTPDPYFLAQGHPMLTPDRSGCVLDEYGVPMDLMDPVVLGLLDPCPGEFSLSYMFSLKWIETNDFNAKFGVGTI